MEGGRDAFAVLGGGQDFEALQSAAHAARTRPVTVERQGLGRHRHPRPRPQRVPVQVPLVTKPRKEEHQTALEQQGRQAFAEDHAE